MKNNTATIPEYNEVLETELLEALRAKANIDKTLKIQEERGNKNAEWLRRHL